MSSRPKLISKVPSVRSCIRAPEGYCFVESDFVTAELRALGFIAPDQNLIRILTEPDPQFGLALMPDETEVPVRIMYAPDCGISLPKQNPSWLMTYTKNGKPINRFRASDLLTDSRGSLRHPKADLHWSLAEMSSDRPREAMDEDIDRKSAKVGNFSSIYGASPNALERKIETDTGRKPELGTGQSLLDALARRQPDATAFLDEVAKAPQDPGYLVAQSGRVRHFALPPRGTGLDSRAYEQAAAAQGREARNFL